MKTKDKLWSLCDRWALVALCVYVAECVLGGSGRWFSFGGLSIRMVLFAVCFVLTLPSLLQQIRSLYKIPQIILCVLLGIYLIIAAFIGVKLGNNPAFIKADITSFMALALLPGYLSVIRNNKNVLLICSVLFYSALALGIITTGIHFYLAFASHSGLNAVNDWLNNHSMGGLAKMSTGLQRIYIRSQIFLQVGLLLGLQKIWSKKGAARWLLFGAEAIMAYACLMTYTRGFWLGFALSACFLLVLYPQQWKHYLSTLGISALLLAALFILSAFAYGKPVAAIEVVNRFDPDLIGGAVFLPGSTTDPTDGDPTEPTDPFDSDADQAAVQLRQKTLRMLGEKISDRPLFGNGLGANLDEIRDDGKTEYTYFDMVMKLGFVGFILFFGVFFLPAFLLLKNRLCWLIAKKQIPPDSLQAQNSVLLTAFIGVALTSFLNPFLINPMGTLLVMLLFAASRCENTIKEKQV